MLALLSHEENRQARQRRKLAYQLSYSSLCFSSCPKRNRQKESTKWIAICLLKDSCFVFEVPGSGTIVAERQEILVFQSLMWMQWISSTSWVQAFGLEFCGVSEYITAYVCRKDFLFFEERSRVKAINRREAQELRKSWNSSLLACTALRFQTCRLLEQKEERTDIETSPSGIYPYPSNSLIDQMEALLRLLCTDQR